MKGRVKIMKQHQDTNASAKAPMIESAADFPDNWEACSRPQLEWLAVNGSYAQRRTADAYLREIKPQ